MACLHLRLCRGVSPRFCSFKASRSLALHRHESLHSSAAALSYHREEARPCLTSRCWCGLHTGGSGSHLRQSYARPPHLLRVDRSLHTDSQKLSRTIKNVWVSTPTYDLPSPIPNPSSNPKSISRIPHCNFSGLPSLQRTWLHTSSWSWFPDGPDQLKSKQTVAARSADTLHTSAWDAVPEKKVASKPGEKKPKIEMAVDTIKEKKKKTVDMIQKPSEAVEQSKPSLARRAWEIVLHYYHGFRLLALDTSVAIRLLFKTLRGKSLTRREQKQFRRTAADIFRVVPFSVFIIIPFMEFLLPVYIWLFPNALPSTFQSKSSKEARRKQELKVKLQMAKFLQGTVEEMAVAGKNPNKKETVQEFAQFFEKIRTSGEQASTDDIIRFSKLFEDELTLDNLSRPQLVALCKLLLLQPIGSSNFLRFQLRMKLRQLEADDKLIQKEGIDSLTVPELQTASQARGMRALGMPADRLKSQLSQWLELHLHQDIPTSLLLLSRALYLPESVPTTDALRATLSTLPENIVEEAEVLVADTVGESVDNKTRIEVIRQQEELIKEEAQEKEKEKAELETTAATDAARTAAEELTDTAPVVSTAGEQAVGGKGESISVEELRELSQAVSSLKGEGSLEEERASLEELKEDREEYCEDVADLAVECRDEELKESKGSARLGRRVESMISKIDQAVQRLDRDFVSSSDGSLQKMQEESSEVITTQQLEAAVEALKGTSCDAKTRSLIAVLDEDHDGNINLEELAEVIEALAKEDTDIKSEHIAQIKELIKKELTLEEEVEHKKAATQ